MEQKYKDQLAAIATANEERKAEAAKQVQIGHLVDELLTHAEQLQLLKSHVLRPATVVANCYITRDDGTTTPAGKIDIDRLRGAGKVEVAVQQLLIDNATCQVLECQEALEEYDFGLDAELLQAIVEEED